MEWKRCAKNGDIFRWFTAIRWISDITQRAHHSKQQHILCANARHICATPNAAIQNCKYFNQKFSECSIFSESLSLSPSRLLMKVKCILRNEHFIHAFQWHKPQKPECIFYHPIFRKKESQTHTHTLRCVEHVCDTKRTIYLCFL